ncbi:MAG TPA: Mur ligase family protein, partial [Mariniphaga sp.]|nr:Mur ligase family protein [Mariniphaga sp.]
MTIKHLYRLFLEHGKVTTDSRKIEEGCLFFALKGINFNGNKYAEEAINKGAVYAIIDEEEYVIGDKTILVENVLATLQELANYHRQKLGIPVIGITGSNGKTTTKELIAAVLSVNYKIVYTQGNLNNHIGVPLTLLQMNEATQMGIIEMGANHEGEIEMLCAIANPDYGIITNIGIAHLEGFGSFDTIKRTKAELYNHLKNKDGLVFYNNENPVLSELAEAISRKVAYGTKQADLTGELISASPYLTVRVNF